MLLAVANRPIDSSTTFVTGGDVSRFQRRSVPAKPTQMAQAMPGAGPAPGAAAPGVASAVPSGPSVRVARGNNITVVPVGAR